MLKLRVSLNGLSGQPQWLRHTTHPVTPELHDSPLQQLASELALSTTSATRRSNMASAAGAGLNEHQARNSVRLSIGRFSTDAEVKAEVFG